MTRLLEYSKVQSEQLRCKEAFHDEHQYAWAFAVKADPVVIAHDCRDLSLTDLIDHPVGVDAVADQVSEAEDRIWAGSIDADEHRGRHGVIAVQITEDHQAGHG